MGIIETAKEAVSLVQRLDNIELTKSLLDLQQQCYDLVFENRDLKVRIHELEATLAMGATLTYRNNAYWTGESDDEQTGPICAPCWDARHLFVRMTRRSKGIAHCQNCNHGIQYGPTDPPMSRGSGGSWVHDY